MDPNEALALISRWLLTQNSAAARILGRMPGITPLLERIKPGRLPELPRPGAELDEEEELGRLRTWFTEGRLSLMLAALSGRLSSPGLTSRYEQLVKGFVGACLEAADAVLRRRFIHPLFLPPGDVGPVAVISLGVGTGVELTFDRPVSPLFLFTRRQPYAPTKREEDFREATLAPSNGQSMIILKEYVLKLSSLAMGFLTLDHPLGAGLAVTSPHPTGVGGAGSQLMSLNQFIDYFSHQADPGYLAGLTRLIPLAGDAKLTGELKNLCRKMITARPWTDQDSRQALAGSRPEMLGDYDPAASPGGLHDLALVVDLTLLTAGRYPVGGTRDRLKKAVAADLLPAELLAAHQALLKGHICLALLGRDLPGHSLASPTDLDAVLSLWPRPAGKPITRLKEAHRLVKESLARLVEED